MLVLSLHMSIKAMVPAGLVDKADTAAHSASGNKISRDRNLGFPGNKLSRTLPNPFGATAGKKSTSKSTSRPVTTHSGRAKKGAAASTQAAQRQQDSSGPEFPPGYSRVIRLHDTTEFPGLGLAHTSSLSKATASQPQQQAALTDQLQSTASKTHRPVNGLLPSSRSRQAATATKTHGQEIPKPSPVVINIRPPPGLCQITPITAAAASQLPPDMSQTASVAGCPAPLPSGLHPAPSFSADSLQLPGFGQAVTAAPEAQLSPELSQASRDSLETQTACLHVCAEANAVAQAHVRSPELPIVPIQAKSAFAQAAAATVWYEPPALSTAHDVTSPDPTVTASNQPGPNTPAVTALASQPGPHQGMNPQQGWGHESVDPTLQAQSGSDSSRAAHHEESSCQSREPWQEVHGNAWAVDQSGSFSTAAQTDHAMLSDMPQQDSSSWDYYEIYKQQQLLDQLDYADSWKDEDNCEDADDDDIIFSHQQLHLYDDSWQDDDRYLQRQHDSSCQHNQGQAQGFDTCQAPYSTCPQRQRQHGSEDDAHELVHDYCPRPVQTDRSAHYQPQFDLGFEAAQQPGRAVSKTKRKGLRGGRLAAMSKAGGSRAQLSATDRLTDRPIDRHTYRPTDRPAKFVAPKQHPSHSKYLQPGHNVTAEKHAMHSDLKQMGAQRTLLGGQRPIASQQFRQQHTHYFKNAQPSAASTASHRSKQCFHSSRNSEHQQGTAGAFSDHHRSSDDHHMSVCDRHRFLDQHDQHAGAGAVSRPGTSMPQIDRQSASFASNSTAQGKVLTVYRRKASSSMHGLPFTGAVPRPGIKQDPSLCQQHITADAGNTQPYINVLVLSQI